MSTDPLEIFNYMVQNEIGSSQALRYTAHAAVLEMKGDFAGADGVFQSGIQLYVRSQTRTHATHFPMVIAVLWVLVVRAFDFLMVVTMTALH